ncbi:MAG: hypothetical protein Q7Q73_03935 [Verrucomicrobiota bacterium JB024]|nr:hypothetical protein [Verrucomicrobiota bacterium JB024]
MNAHEKEWLMYLSAIKSRLHQTTETWQQKAVTLRGKLPLDHRDISNTRTAVTVEIYIPSGWENALPKITPTATSIYKSEVDWHCFPDGSICYLLNHAWLYHGLKMLEQFSRQETAVFMANWACDAAALLLYRHKAGREMKLGKWPDHWAQYKHGDKGVDQFYTQYPDAGKYISEPA